MLVPTTAFGCLSREVEWLEFSKVILIAPAPDSGQCFFSFQLIFHFTSTLSPRTSLLVERSRRYSLLPEAMSKHNAEFRLEYSSQKDGMVGLEVAEMTVDDETEKRLRRKFDRRILPFGVLIWLMANIDRTNTGNAIILGMREDADLTGNRFNMTLTGFYLTYILLEMSVNHLLFHAQC